MKILVSALLFALIAAHSQVYSYLTFDPPGSTSTQVKGINNAGVIVGSYNNAAGTHNFIRSADGSAYQTIDLPGAVTGSTTVDAINNLGQIAGTFSDASSQLVRCYVQSAGGGAFTPFDVPNFVPGGTGPRAINDQGAITGWRIEISASVADGFLRNPDGTFMRIAANDGADGTRSMGINNQGEVVGYYRAGGSGGLDHGFLRTPDGVYTAFDLPGTDSWTRVTSINNHGQIAGYRLGVGFVSNGDGSFSMVPPASRNESITAVGAVNDNGVVAGSVSDGVTTHGFIAFPSANSQPRIRATPSGVVTATAFGGASTFGSTAMITPGGWIEIYGQNLASTTRSWRSSDFSGSTAPTSLDGVSVRIGGREAFISYVSPGQVNALAPGGIPSGDTLLTLTNGAQTTVQFNVTVQNPNPSLLVLPRTGTQDAQYLGAVFPDFATFVLPPGYVNNLPVRRAKPGDTIVLFGVALGPVAPDVPVGQIAGAAPLLTTPQVSFNGIPALVTYAGTAPGTVGLYQMNVVVPNIVMPPGRSFNDGVIVRVQIGGSNVPSGPQQYFSATILPVELP